MLHDKSLNRGSQEPQQQWGREREITSELIQTSGYPSWYCDRFEASQ